MKQCDRPISKWNNQPGTFVCPLTYNVMEEPVMDHCAHNFDRAAILEWIEQGNNFCPISRKELSAEDLVPNHKLAEQIEEWKWKKDTEPALRHPGDMSTSDASSERPSQESDDDYEDEETGHLTPKKQRFLGSGSGVPAEMMLLPQERRLLEYMHAQEEHEMRQRRRRCWMKCVGVGIFVISSSVAGLIVWTLLRPEEEEIREGP